MIVLTLETPFYVVYKLSKLQLPEFAVKSLNSAYFRGIFSFKFIFTIDMIVSPLSKQAANMTYVSTSDSLFCTVTQWSEVPWHVNEWRRCLNSKFSRWIYPLNFVLCLASLVDICLACSLEKFYEIFMIILLTFSLHESIIYVSFVRQQSWYVNFFFLSANKFEVTPKVLVYSLNFN